MIYIFQGNVLLALNHLIWKKKKNKHCICPNNRSNPMISILQYIPMRSMHLQMLLSGNQIHCINTRKKKVQELSFLHVTLLHDLIYVPTQHFQMISNSMGVMAYTRFWLQGKLEHNEESESCLSCMWHTLLKDTTLGYNYSHTTEHCVISPQKHAEKGIH